MTHSHPTDIPGTVTEALALLREGQGNPADVLAPLVYEELLGLARNKMRGQPPDHTLQPTALLHESLLRIFKSCDIPWEDRRHLIQSAATAMRSVLVDHARGKSRQIRKPPGERVLLDQIAAQYEANSADLGALDDALEDLVQREPRLAQVVELRFFAGLSHKEAAKVLNLSTRQVERDWKLARGLLRDALCDE